MRIGEVGVPEALSLKPLDARKRFVRHPQVENQA
jgi:hypothetical protein